MNASKKSFRDSMIHHMVTYFNIKDVLAENLADKYIDEIETDQAIVQQLGHDYFAIQILMAESIIPYKPM